MKDLLWQPTEAAIKKTNLIQFIHKINSEHSLRLVNYEDLYQWKIL